MEFLIGLVVFVVSAYCLWKIAEKMGFHGIIGLLLLVPGVNFFIILYLAFGTWPIHGGSFGKK